MPNLPAHPLSVFASDLPVELIRALLRVATLPKETYPFIDSSDPYSRIRCPSIPPPDIEATRAQNTLSLVCRVFHQMTEEFVYEALHITTSAEAETLASLLSSSLRVKSGVGYFTKSLYIQMLESDASTRFANVDDFSDALVQIIRGCRALKALHLDRTAIFSLTRAERLQDVFSILPTGLIHLELDGMPTHDISFLRSLFCEGNFQKYLTSDRGASLKVLRLTESHDGIPSIPVPRTELSEDHEKLLRLPAGSFPALTHLTIVPLFGAREVQEILQMLSLKSLVHLEVGPRSSRRTRFKTRFWTTLSVSNLRTVHVGLMPSTSSKAFLSEVLGCLPHLEELAYHWAPAAGRLNDDLNLDWQTPSVMRYLRHVDARIVRFQDDKEARHAADLQQHLRPLLTLKYPALESFTMSMLTTSFGRRAPSEYSKDYTAFGEAAVQELRAAGLQVHIRETPVMYKV